MAKYSSKSYENSTSSQAQAESDSSSIDATTLQIAKHLAPFAQDVAQQTEKLIPILFAGAVAQGLQKYLNTQSDVSISDLDPIAQALLKDQNAAIAALDAGSERAETEAKESYLVSDDGPFDN